MAWTSPKTWVTGELVEASEMNTYVSDNDQHLFDSRAKTAGDTMTGAHKWTSGQPEVERTDGAGDVWLTRIDFPTDDSPRWNVRKNGALHARIEWDEANSRWLVAQDLRAGGALTVGDDAVATEPYVDVRDVTSRANDLSDITAHTLEATTSSSNHVVFDISGTAGIVLGGIIQGHNFGTALLTIDGQGNTLSTADLEDSAGNSVEVVHVPPVHFDSSAKLEFNSGSGTTKISGYAWTRSL